MISNPPLVRHPPQMLGALVLGLLMAVLCCLDPFLSRLHLPYAEYLKIYPFTFTALVVVSSVSVLLFVMSFPWLWARKEMTSLVVILGAAQFTGISVATIDTLEATTGVVFALWLIVMLADRQQPLRASAVIPMMLGIAACTVWTSVNVYAPWLLLSIVGMVGLGIKILVYFLLTQLITTPQLIRFAVRVTIGTAAFTAIVGIAQELIYYFYGIPLTLMRHSETYEILKPTPVGLLLRASGFMPQPQHLSGYCLFALPMMLFLATGSSTPTRWKIRLWCIASLTAIAIVLTLSIGAWIALTLIVLLFPYFRWPEYTFHITVAILVLILAVYFSGILVYLYNEVMQSGLGSGAGDRKKLLLLGIDKLKQNPFLGTGLRMFLRYSGNYKQHPVHNAYLQAATEIGIVGAAFFCLIIAWLILHLSWLALLMRSPEGKMWPKMLLLGLLSLVVVAMTEPAFDHPNTWIFIGLCDAAVLTMRRSFPTSDGDIMRMDQSAETI